MGAIEGFQIGVDKIDVSDIDANVDLAGHQAFAFMGIAQPTAPGQITLIDSPNDQTIIQLNTGNDLKPESEIAINDDSRVFASAYTASNFILSPLPPDTSSASKPPEIGQVQTFREGDLVSFKLSYTDPNNDAEGFGFRV